MLAFIYAKFTDHVNYSECRYAECRVSLCWCHYAECRGTDYYNTKLLVFDQA
jgi:hypothetical protein